ncbi:MAG TPA: ribonuclease Z [Cyclobacteriaceae bacterium]|nr:ribonuclease Z [Cyclobacteriaceae bacterium]HRK55422.1 ribonuclease Z [Cyclobacteriaceae bacterium]
MSFQLTILGSSGALPAYGRFPSSQYLNIKKQHILIDCGEGIQTQLKRFSIPTHKIDKIFISHLHGDHYLGLMGLLFSMHLNRRTNDLHLYSQPGLDQIITLQLKYSKSVLNYKLIFHPIPEGNSVCLYEDKSLTVDTIPLKHKVPCTGFLFREKEKPRRIDKDKLPKNILLEHIAQLKSGKDVFNEEGDLLYKNTEYTLPPRPSHSFAYCSDTAYDENIVAQIKGVDLLYHEATFMQEHMDKAVMTLHSTTLQAAKIASLAKVKCLLIGHYSARYKELDALQLEAATVFQNTKLAIEGETIDLEKL